jgi:hypothetical protein
MSNFINRWQNCPQANWTISQIRWRMRRFFVAQTALLAPHPDRSGGICSVLAPWLHKKSLAAYVSVFMKRPTETWQIAAGRIDIAQSIKL